MSDRTYNEHVTLPDRPLVWLHGAIQTPPFSTEARLEVGVLLRSLQRGENLGLPSSRPLPSLGTRCHELRIVDEEVSWRLLYRIDADAIIIVDVFAKKTRATPRSVIDTGRLRLRRYDAIAGERG